MLLSVFFFKKKEKVQKYTVLAQNSNWLKSQSRSMAIFAGGKLLDNLGGGWGWMCCTVL